MLSAERLCELPLELRICIANTDAQIYKRMYIYDVDFREYVKNIGASLFIKQIKVEVRENVVLYKMDDIVYSVNSRQDVDWTIDILYGSIFHNLDGPAISQPDGYRAYYVHGKIHRLNGPARIWLDGKEEYWQNGNLHRLDGPAIIYTNGTEEYWQNGVHIS
jgi:hypothetical protein